MAQPRLNLHKILESITGVEEVYFQPPQSIQLKYPCIIYKMSGKKDVYADNKKYTSLNVYTVTVIDRDPDSNIPDLVGSLQLSGFDRIYSSKGLYHTVYKINF